MNKSKVSRSTKLKKSRAGARKAGSAQKVPTAALASDPVRDDQEAGASGRGTHLDHWGLTSRPFENVPNPKDFLLFKTHKEALELLRYVVEERKTAALLLGGHGTGKTTAIRVLLSELDLEQVRVAILDYPLLESGALFLRILEQIGADPHMSAGERMHDILGANFLELASRVLGSKARQSRHRDDSSAC